MAHRTNFYEALIKVAQACEGMHRRGLSRPVLAGGAAVEFYTNGLVTTGDFDFVTAAQVEFEQELERVGFRRENRPGRAMRGLYHPTLNMGVEVVSSRLYEGNTDRSKVLLVDFETADHASLPIAPREDMIADRLGQYNSTPKGVPEMLKQAILLFTTATRMDARYLDKRIREETGGDWTLKDLEARL